MHHQRLNAYAAGLSCAAVGAAAVVVCAVFYSLAPNATLAFFNLLFHGIDFEKVLKPITFGGVILGAIIFAVVSYVLTWLWASWYNRLLNSGKSTDGTGSKNCCA